MGGALVASSVVPTLKLMLHRILVRTGMLMLPCLPRPWSRRGGIISALVPVTRGSRRTSLLIGLALPALVRLLPRMMPPALTPKAPSEAHDVRMNPRVRDPSPM